MKTTLKTIGELTHNPLKIRKSKHKWIDKIKHDNTPYEQFDSYFDGYRAGCLLIELYYSVGNQTISQIINTWSHNTENNTENYIRYICVYTGLFPHEHIMLSNRLVKSILKAMCMYENGKALRFDILDILVNDLFAI